MLEHGLVEIADKIQTFTDNSARIKYIEEIRDLQLFPAIKWDKLIDMWKNYVPTLVAQPYEDEQIKGE